MRNDKLLKYLKLARFNAELFSKDRSRKVGALLVSPDDGTILSPGYNGLPRGCQDEIDARHQRPEKYFWFEHGERNAIYNRARPMLKGSVAVMTHAPGPDCARALASVGVASVVTHAPADPSARRWQVVLEMLAELDIELVLLDRGGRSRYWRQEKLERFMREAQFVAQEFSKAPFERNATLFLSRGDYSVLTQGYNGQPRGCDDSKLERAAPGQRAFWYEESARNAIFNAVRRELAGCIAVVTLAPCMDCARALAAIGAKAVVSPAIEATVGDTFGPHWEKVAELYAEVGIELIHLDERDETGGAAQRPLADGR